MDYSVPVFAQPDIVAGEEMSAFFAQPHLSERPPVLVAIARLKKEELAARGIRQSHPERSHTSGFVASEGIFCDWFTYQSLSFPR